jgi:curved DNA-binding protein
MKTPDHYGRLGLERGAAPEAIREAYRRLSRQHHPDLNPGSAEALERTMEINESYEVLSDPERRAAHEREWDLAMGGAASRAAMRRKGVVKPLTQDVALGIDELFRGGTHEVEVRDPGNPDGPEVYALEIPAGTAPGVKFRLKRVGWARGGVVVVRVTVRPGFRFKARGSDVRCDLRISEVRAAEGGLEWVEGPDGTRHRVTLPKGVGRGELLKVEGAGLPRMRGGRGDLWVRVEYRVTVRVRRTTGR